MKSGKRLTIPFINRWNKACQTAFEELREKLTTAPVLTFPDFSKPFRLETDASQEGLGAVLSQEHDGKYHVIANARLRPTERNMDNYSSMKLEFLALKWAVTEKFRSYLLEAEFEVLTDNNPLSHLETAKLSAVEQRWASQLALFNFKITYKPGKNNQNADALSRMPSKPQTVTEKPEAALVSTSSGTTTLATLAMSAQVPPEITAANQDETYLVQLERQAVSFIPEDEVSMMILDIKRTLQLIRTCFYWPRIHADVEKWIKCCERCTLAKMPQPRIRTPMGSLLASQPLEVLVVDFTVLEPATDGRENVLVMTDVFTKFTHTVPTRDQKAATTVES